MSSHFNAALSPTLVFSMVPQHTLNSIVLGVSSLPLLRPRKTSAHRLQSRSLVGDSISSVLSMGSVPVSCLMSSCPHRVVSVGEVPVPCLVDTGSMVSKITESVFLLHFEPWGQE